MMHNLRVDSGLYLDCNRRHTHLYYYIILKKYDKVKHRMNMSLIKYI